MAGAGLGEGGVTEIEIENGDMEELTGTENGMDEDDIIGEVVWEGEFDGEWDGDGDEREKDDGEGDELIELFKAFWVGGESVDELDSDDGDDEDEDDEDDEWDVDVTEGDEEDDEFNDDEVDPLLAWPPVSWRSSNATWSPTL